MMASLQPKAAALYTSYKQQEFDYSWYVETGQPVLFDEMEELYRTLLASRGGNSDQNPRGDAPLVCVIIEQVHNGQRIGLLIGAMPTKRKDPRIIYDTLYLEFDVQDKKATLSSIATLLDTYDHNDEFVKYGQYLEPFLKYAEEYLYAGTEKTIQTMNGKIQKSGDVLPISLEWDETIEPFTQNESWKSSEVAVLSSPPNRKKCARYLRTLAEAETLPESLVLFSTGQVGKDQLQQYADKHTGKTLIMLTLSDTVKDEEDLKQRFEGFQEVKEELKQKVSDVSESVKKHFSEQISEPLEKIAQNIPEPVKKWLGLGVILAFGSVIWFFTLDRTPPQLASLTLFSSNIIENAGKPIPRFGKGALQMTFSEAVQNVSLIVNQVGQHNSDPLEFASTDSNQAETFEITVADVKDEAGNVMKPATFTAQIESAEIRAELFDAIRIVQKDGALFAAIQVNASAKYGVKAVSILDVPAALTQTPEVWQAEIPLPLAPKMPLTAVIRDAHDNEIRVRLP